MNPKLDISIKKSAQALPEQLQKTFENREKDFFDTKNGPKWGLKMVKFWPKISIFEVSYQPFELKIDQKSAF